MSVCFPCVLVLVPCGADKEIGHVVGMIKQNGNLSELIDELQKIMHVLSEQHLLFLFAPFLSISIFSCLPLPSSFQGPEPPRYELPRHRGVQDVCGGV